MRFGVGLAILGVGVVGLGWWARSEYAPHMQNAVTNAAQQVAEGSVHGVIPTVEGRDIRVTGLADGPAERDALIAHFTDIRGRRIVHDDLTVLPVADPFNLTANWMDGALTAEGSAPTRLAQEGLAAMGAEGLTLAAGAPDGQWARAAGIGIAALHDLEEGQMALSGRRISMIGVARTPAEGETVRAALDALPEGYQADLGLRYLDDGTPPDYAVHFTAAGGAYVDGKLPLAVDAAAIAAALGLPSIDNNATQGLLGEDGTVPAAVLSALTPWLGEVETMDVSVAQDGTGVDAGFGAGADLDLLQAALEADLQGTGVAVAVSVVAPEGEDGTQRTNAVTGRQEVLRGGYWLPVAAFDATADGCATEVTSVLSSNRIGFVTGSARLDARARSAVNALAAVLGVCLGDVGLRAEIGGHTDSTGSEEANLALSLARAEAVRAALLERGVSASALTAAGYGPAEPIADNATEEGRAANRRTAVRWIE